MFEQLKQASRPMRTRAAVAAQVGGYGLQRARSAPLRTTAALALVGIAAALATSPRAREAIRRSVSQLSGTLRRG
jgi:hypothetical protein